MRCPDCNKFVSFDTDGEPEVSLDVDADGVVSGSCCIVNACAECSTELTSAEFSVDCDLSDAVSVHRACDCGAEGQRIEMETQQREGTLPFCAETCQSRKSHVLDVEGEATRDERTQTHDRHGKLLTGPSRYRKH